MNNLKKGFTLIELLVVIAVLGVLITVVIVAIDPIQQLAKARDSGRQNSVSQIGNALVAYATSNNNLYPTVAQWNAVPNQLVASGEISSIPGLVVNSSGVYCTSNPINGWCYSVNGAGPVIVYSLMEAKVNIAKCAPQTGAWALYSSADGRGGIVCTATSATQPGAPAAAGAFTWK